MTTITGVEGRVLSLQYIPDAELSTCIKDAIGHAQALLGGALLSQPYKVIYSDDNSQVDRHQLPTGELAGSLGRRPITVTTQAAQTLTAMFEQMQHDMSYVRNTVEELAKPRIINAACEVLQMAAGACKFPGSHRKLFQQLGVRNAGIAFVATHTGTSPSSVIAKANGVASHRHKRMAHCTSLAALETEVAAAAGMITPGIRSACEDACWVIEHYADFKEAYSEAVQQAANRQRPNSSDSS